MDENKPIGEGLPDKEFIKTRQVILDLLEFMMKPGKPQRTPDEELWKTKIDMACEEIGHVWRDR